MQKLSVFYGGSSGRDDAIDMTTRSMLQVMRELAAFVRVPESDLAQGRVAPGLVSDVQPEEPANKPPLAILCGDAAPKDAYVAVHYGGRWSGFPTRTSSPSTGSPS